MHTVARGQPENLPKEQHLYSLRQFLLRLQLRHMLNWLASKPQQSPPHCSLARMTRMHYHTWHVYEL